jgi:hypothetical protein
MDEGAHQSAQPIQRLIAKQKMHSKELIKMRPVAFQWPFSGIHWRLFGFHCRPMQTNADQWSPLAFIGGPLAARWHSLTVPSL